MRIGYKEVGPGNPTYIIAEIGINHSGSVEIAKQLIDVAVIAGASAVKFQKRAVEAVYTKEELAKPRESPFGCTNGDLKRGLEFNLADYAEIDDYCHEKKIDWFASPWDVASVDFLQNFDIPVYKVASACITDHDLLERIAETKKPVILSTGMSTELQIDKAICSLSRDRDLSYPSVALMVCTSTYPAKLEELNLSRITEFQRKWIWPVGYSGHESGLWTTLAAVAMGATIIERHITLDRSSWGSDQSASVEPYGFIKLCREIRDFEKARGDGKIRILPSEVPIMEKLRRYR